jgi:hypothetical protein
MIPKKPAPDLIRGGYRFSEKIMLRKRVRALWRFNLKPWRSEQRQDAAAVALAARAETAHPDAADCAAIAAADQLISLESPTTAGRGDTRPTKER